jgi:tetratricopeptide (TPR) repeat protein
MRVTRIRILAWGMGLAVAAVLLAGSRGGARQGDVSSLPVARTMGVEGKPRLFRLEGPADPLVASADAANMHESSAAAQKPVAVAAGTDEDWSDSPIRELPPARIVNAQPAAEAQGQVIREPRTVSATAPQPMPAPSAKYALETPTNPPSATLPVPVELLLTAPERQESPVAPRVTQEVTVEPEAASAREFSTKAPAPAPLPIMSADTPAMRPVNDVASAHVQRGFSLGERNAIYAARTEFIQSLRTIAQAVDAQAGLAPKDTLSCSQALVRGLEALTEADDFAPRGSRLDGDLDLPAMIAAHRTPACKLSVPPSQLAALQAYFDYAGQQLSRAAAGNPVASQALTGLGKTYTSGKDASSYRLANAKAMVFHQAAISADPGNHLAANELGVLLGKFGQWQQAKQAFILSLRKQTDPATWQNLAAAHARLGEQELASLALQERALLLRNKLPNAYSGVDGSATVRWVDPKAFGGPPEEAQLAVQPKAGAGVPSPARASSTPRTAQKSDAWSWLPWR